MPIDKANRRIWLRNAAVLVEEVMNTLDLSEAKCDHCSRTSHRNWNETQAHKELEAIARKLKKFAQSDVFKG